MTNPIESYHHRVAHVETTKIVNNRYSTPVTLKFAAVTKEKTISIAQKHVIIFAAIKLLGPSATIKFLKGVVYQHQNDFPYSQAYQDAFEVILDKNIHSKPHIYVKHIIESTLQVNQMKFGQHNTMNILHQQHASLKFAKFSTYREASIGWFKYINTSLTLQFPAKLRVKKLLNTAHLTQHEIALLTTINHKPVTDTPKERSRKRIGEDNHDVDDEWK